MFKSYWERGFDWHEKSITRNGYTLTAMFPRFKVEAGSLAARQLSQGYKASRLQRKLDLERMHHA